MGFAPTPIVARAGLLSLWPGDAEGTRVRSARQSWDCEVQGFGVRLRIVKTILIRYHARFGCVVHSEKPIAPRNSHS
jgi:hypothetical protein